MIAFTFMGGIQLTMVEERLTAKIQGSYVYFLLLILLLLAPQVL